MGLNEFPHFISFPSNNNIVVFCCPTSLKEDGSGSAYDKESMAIIKLNNTTVLYLKEVTKFLALVCILREESFERKGWLSGKSAAYLAAIAVSIKCIYILLG